MGDHPHSSCVPFLLRSGQWSIGSDKHGGLNGFAKAFMSQHSIGASQDTAATMLNFFDGQELSRCETDRLQHTGIDLPLSGPNT
jgi:hypothetical protein